MPTTPTRRPEPKVLIVTGGDTGEWERDAPAKAKRRRHPASAKRS